MLNYSVAELRITYSDTTEKSPRNRRYGLFRSYFVPERHCKSLFQRDCQKERRTPSRKVSDSGESVREVRRSVSVK